MKVTIKDEAGIPREYTYKKLQGMYNDLVVDEFNIMAEGGKGLPYQIQLIESETEVRVLCQLNNYNPEVSRKNIFKGMLTVLFNIYNKKIVSSSLILPQYNNEQRAPDTAGKMYKRLLAEGIVYRDYQNDVYYYKE